MDAIRELQQFGIWLLAIVSLLSGLFSYFVALLFAVPRYYRWKIVHEGGNYNRASFFDAVQNGDRQLDLVRWFLYAGINANRMQANATALITAVARGQAGTVAILIKAHWLHFGRRWADPALTDGTGLSPVQAAVNAGRLDIYDALVAAGAQTDPQIRAAVLRQVVEAGRVAEIDGRMAVIRGSEIDLPGPDGRNALLMAVERGREAIVEKLLRRANVDARGPLGETPLIVAAEGGYLGIVRALLDRNPTVDAADHGGRTALMAAILGGHEQIANLLRARTSGGEREARLILAAEVGDEAQVRALLEAGANPNVQARGRSPLLGAARRGHTAVGRLLVVTGQASLSLTDEHGATALMLAAEAGATDFVRMLLSRGVDVNAARDDGSTALMDAVTAGKVHVVKELLDREPMPAVDAPRRSDGFTSLMAAVESGSRKIVRRLLRARADPNAQTETGVSPLSIAITNGDREMAKLLREHGARVGAEIGELFVAARLGDLQKVKTLLAAGVSANVSHGGRTPLLEAVRRGHAEVAAELIGHGADVNHSGSAGTALEWAARFDRLEIVRLLLDAGAQVDGRGQGGKTPLIVACERNHPRTVNELLARNADVDAVDELGRTPLLAAILGGYEEIDNVLRAHGATKGELEAQLILAAREARLEEVQDILAAGPNVNARGPHGESALTLACESRDPLALDVVQALLAVGAEPNVKTASGKTPLVVTARDGRLDLIEALRQAGAQVDLTGREGRTPLMAAAENGHVEVVKRLLEVKKNQNDRDRSGLTALMLAASNGHAGVVSLLASSADVNARDGSGATALIHAALHQQLGAASHLLEKGADADARDSFGETALMIALVDGDRPMETLLRGKTSAGEKEVQLLHAAEQGRLETVQALLEGDVEKRARVNDRRRGQNTPLIAAIENGHRKVATLLIEQAADVNIPGRAGRTALIAAAARGDLELVQLLTRHGAGATIEATDDRGRTAVLATTSPDIRLHLKETCGAIQPDDDVHVASHGRRYHVLKDCGGLNNAASSPRQLRAALDAGLRPCTTCITRRVQRRAG